MPCTLWLQNPQASEENRTAVSPPGSLAVRVQLYALPNASYQKNQMGAANSVWLYQIADDQSG